MFRQNVKRIGYACKYMHPEEVRPKKLLQEIEQPLNGRATTVTWLNRQTREVAEQRLWDIMEYNIQAYYNLVEFTGSLPNELRMVRIGSGVLPVYTEPNWSYFWRRSDVVRYCERHFAKVGELARLLDVRLSTHPGQFVVLASDNDDIVNRSIEEYEYHIDVARWMGYGKNWQDFKCNVHISGRRGPEGIKDILPKLSPEALNCLTIENDENKWGLDASLELAEDVALVLDIHHHWVNSGEYIEVEDDRVRRVIDSWRGVRPVIHYSVSREDYLIGYRQDHRPVLVDLLEQGYKKQKLRAHSDMFWNDAVNEWAISFNEQFDIMCESKCKQIASIGLYNQMYQKNVSAKYDYEQHTTTILNENFNKAA